MTVFALILAALCTLLLIHPFITYPLSLQIALRFASRKELLAPSMDVSAPLRFSVCMCAYNEEKVISAKAKNLLEIIDRYPGSEVLIYIDGNTDRTSELLAPFEGRFTIICGEGRQGKTHGMKLLVSKARNELLLFTDANIDVDVDSLNHLQRYFSDARVGCVGTTLKYESVVSATGSSNASYRKLEERMNRLESRLGSALVADGALFAIRKKLYEGPADDLIDDMYVSMNVLCQGFRIIQADDIIAREQSSSVQKEEFRRKVRISCQAFNIHRLLWPKLRTLGVAVVYQYVSHKLLRWFGIVPLVGAFLFGLLFLASLGWWYLSIAAAISPLVVGALAKAFPRSLFAKVASVFLAILATGLGVAKSMRGERFQTWEPVESIRAEH